MQTKTILLAVLAASLAGCGSSENDQATTTSTAVEAPAKVHAIGEAVPLPGLEVMITSVSEAKKPGDSPYAPEAGDGEIFVIALYEIKNIGTTPIAVDDLPEVELADGKGVAYDQADIAAAYAGEYDPFGKVNPGITYKSAGVWKVAKGTLDRATWKIVVDAEPRYEVSLK